MVEIRPISTKDDEQVREMITHILEKEFPEDRGHFGEDIQNVSKHYSGKGDGFFVAVAKDKIVGTVGVKRDDDRNALLRRIFVHPSYRKKKIGLKLIQEAIDFCKKQGYNEIVFKTTSRMGAAIQLCEANGFHRRATIELAGLNLFKFTKYLGKDGD